MNTKAWIAIVSILVLGICISGCGAGQLPRPSATPVPSSTPTSPISPAPTATKTPLLSPGSEISKVKPITPSALSNLPDMFPSIQSSPKVPNFGRGKLDSVPTYNPYSSQMWQMDLRAYDMSGLDLRNSLDDLLYADFDSRTIWPSPEKMPPEFDWQKIMEMGKNPGLGIRQLHGVGVTGRGVGIAIIDQPLLVEHQEYASQLRLYESDNLSPDWTFASMHGPTVASIAVGKTVGVAPDADLYYIATDMCNTTGNIESNDYSCLAHSIRRVLEINNLLPQDRKIRVISISVGWGHESKGYDEITAATKEAKDAGLLVICSNVEEIHGFKFSGLGREPLADPDKFASYQPGLFWTDQFYSGYELTDTLLVPMDSRTTASLGGAD
jgi:subtilisin family serine protease